MEALFFVCRYPERRHEEVPMSLGIQLTEIKQVLLGDRWHEVEHEFFVIDT